MQVVATELVLGEGVVAGDKVTVDPEESPDDEGEGAGEGVAVFVGVGVGQRGTVKLREPISPASV